MADDLPADPLPGPAPSGPGDHLGAPPLRSPVPQVRTGPVPAGPVPTGPAGGRRSRVAAWLAGAAIVIGAVVLAGFAIRLPYTTFSPGGTLDVQPRVTVHGARTYPNHGPLMLLFVRERSHVNVWRWLQAKLDSNDEIVRTKDLTQNRPSEEVDAESVSDMTISQLDAEKAALSFLGYRVPPAAGALVTAVLPSKPAGRVLRIGDLVIAADGHAVRAPGDLARYVVRHRAGTTVSLRIVRDGHPRTVSVGVARSGRTRVIGVLTTTTYRFPVSISIDTSDISGPSGGLAMTLAIIDDLTPGDLTGGKRVAVTGTIAPDGSVGQIGAIAQKAVSARAAHAQLFIVPSCGPAVGRPAKGYDAYVACRHDLAVARSRAGEHVDLVAVSTLRQALAALRRAGGAALPPRSGR